MPKRDFICPVCRMTIEPRHRVSFQQGELLHVDCYKALGLKQKPPTRAARREEPKQDDEAARD